LFPCRNRSPGAARTCRTPSEGVLVPSRARPAPPRAVNFARAPCCALMGRAWPPAEPGVSSRPRFPAFSRMSFMIFQNPRDRPEHNCSLGALNGAILNTEPSSWGRSGGHHGRFPSWPAPSRACRALLLRLEGRRPIAARGPSTCFHRIGRKTGGLFASHPGARHQACSLTFFGHAGRARSAYNAFST